MNNRIKLLDCTLRDGGQLLEAHNCNQKFGIDNIIVVAQKLSEAEIDIIELGFVNIKDKDYCDIALFPGVESISSIIPKRRKKEQLFSALFPDPDYPVEMIPEHTEDYCDIIRVILRYSELQKSLDFCKRIARKGYKVFIQPMVTARYTIEDIQMVMDAANEMAAYALYFVDSYGYMTGQDIDKYFTLFDECLDYPIHIGFHAHNNMNLAFSNALRFLEHQGNRQLILDSCIMGMGQGAGNLQTELIIAYLNKHHGKSYNYDSVLEACEIIERLWNENLWGYSVARLLSAVNNTAYKFSEALREIHSLSFVEINHLLKNISEQMRHRYTENNVKKLLEMNEYRKHYNVENK
jgi:4-hydroxy 2-oxovalerate aldolase